MHHALTLVGPLWGVLLSALAAPAWAQLAAPWDVPVQVAGGSARPCPRPPDLPVSVATRSYYADPSHSIVDAARKRTYGEDVRPLHDAARHLASFADAWRRRGDADAARCAVIWLEHFAAAQALTGAAATNQAVYVQGWVVGAFALDWLKVRSAPVGTSSSDRTRVTSWLAAAAERNIAYYERRAEKLDGRNNHRYWAGMTAMAAGIAANRLDLFEAGSRSLQVGIAQIQPDGTLPLELARRSRALHYHLFACAPLVMLAELAAANGRDFYGARDGALVRLAGRALSGLADPSFFVQRAGVTQEPVATAGDTIAWIVPFLTRFPDRAPTTALERARTAKGLYIGGAPPM